MNRLILLPLDVEDPIVALDVTTDLITALAFLAPALIAMPVITT